MPRYKNAQILKAIQGNGEKGDINYLEPSHGIKMVICKRLGCARATLDARLKKNTTLMAAFREQSENILDFAEGKLYEQVAIGNLGAICFLLKTRGKSRGYIERHDITSGDEKIDGFTVVVRNSDDA